MSSPSITALCLPNSLLLLVHLHILEYAHANSAEYDHNIFNLRTRGLRERAKTMEDIAYFLVGKIEGKGVKTKLDSRLIPMQSTLRIARIQDLFDKIYREPSTPKYLPRFFSIINKWKGTSKPSFADLDSGAVGWWWKDVVVRKSLWKNVLGTSSDTNNQGISPANYICQALLRSQPLAYSTALAQYQNPTCMDEERIQSQSSVTASKYSTLSTVRLQALAESGFQELLQRPWVGEDGKKPSSSSSRHLDSEKRMRQTLADALARVEKRSLEMSEKFKSLITTRTAHGGPTTSGFGFWNLSNERVGTINFSPEPDRELMASLGFELEFDILQSDGVDDDEALERKIEDIRGRKSVGSRWPEDAQATVDVQGLSGELNNEVDRLVDETHDFQQTTKIPKMSIPRRTRPPEAKRTEVNRIWTAGTPATAKKGTPKPRESAALALLLDMDPPMGMPRLASSTWSVSSDEFGGGIGASEDSDGGWAARNVDATPRPARRSMHRQVSKSIDSEDEEGEKILEDEGLTDEEDVFGDDPPSMTLKEILLSADTSHFDLLEAGSEDMEEGMLVEDASFVWE
ncbi:hypothetical protein BDZ97DRAFT_1759575 [Flammula alnicola]|nr:hypothetical protein BDZ97DRAFT_1759575 [Flammula alnicola]